MDTSNFLARIERREATVGILGLGYVGLPLALTFLRRGFPVVGFDVDQSKITQLSAGKNYFRHIPADDLGDFVRRGQFSPTSDFAQIRRCDALILCVPTPLTDNREPDMTYVQDTAAVVAKYLRAEQLVVLESTTYPGTTDELLRQTLEASGLRAGEQFFLAYSPEREDPGNPQYATRTIPKLVGGLTPACGQVAVALYSAALERVVPVSSPAVAEMAKLLENIFRSVNIALVNELKVLCHHMGIDVWEVINAAKTKPFGYMAFYPGPGLGGHCIPIDPFYLTWKARAYELSTRFIELAGEINTDMPRYVVRRTMEALNQRKKAMNGAEILVLGVAYKKDVEDVRESPAFNVMEVLEHHGATVCYHDPFVPAVRPGRRTRFEMTSKPLTDELLSRADAVLIVTDHTNVDYARVVARAQLVVDTRNATAAVTLGREKIVQA